LNCNKAPGAYGIVPRILVKNSDLLYIFKKSIECGRVPSDWEKANVTAIFKKGKTSPCNYRPVSLTSQVCKILESIVKDNMFVYIRIGLD